MGKLSAHFHSGEIQTLPGCLGLKGKKKMQNWCDRVGPLTEVSHCEKPEKGEQGIHQDTRASSGAVKQQE